MTSADAAFDGSLTDDELLGWFDEALPAERLAAIETLLRNSPELQQRVARLVSERDQGAISVGDVWRRYRLSCPTREELGSYLLGVLEPAFSQHVQFHVETIGCRFCQANIADLEDSRANTPQQLQRREKIFESSAGHMRRWRDSE